MEDEDKIMQQIVSFAKTFYEKLDFAHNIEHGKRVVRNAKLIMQQEDGNKFLIEAGSWLHQFHDNLEEVQKFINTLDINEKLKKDLFEIVKCRPSKINEESSIEAKIVYDADAIEVLSTYGMIREILCNIKCRDKNWEDTIEDTISVQERFRKKLMTNTAKNMLQKDFAVIDEFWKLYEEWL